MTREPTDDAWDICTDFLEPLAEMLWEWKLNLDQSHEPPEYEYDDDGDALVKQVEYRTDYAHDPHYCEWTLFNLTWTWTLRLVNTWLEVNVSCEVADRVAKRIAEVKATVKDHSRAGWWPDTGEACWYFSDLARVLRQRQGTPISKTELEAEQKEEADNYRGPFTVGELTNGKRRKDGTYRKGLLGITRSTLYARKKKTPGMFREGIGGLFVHKSLLPNR